LRIKLLPCWDDNKSLDTVLSNSCLSTVASIVIKGIVIPGIKKPIDKIKRNIASFFFITVPINNNNSSNVYCYRLNINNLQHNP
jgi:hypothetical protein